MTQYKFTLDMHHAQAHEYVSDLISQAYDAKNAGAPTSAQERVDKADALIEAYYESIGQPPDSAVLSRLAWYIDFDHMTDNHPDKMSREVTPVMSRWQELVRGEKHISLKAVEYGDRRGNGRRKSAFIGKDGYVGVGNNRMPNSDDGTLADVITRVDVASLIEDALLTDKQRQVIDLIYYEKETQVSAGRRLRISQQAVAKHLDAALRKLRDTATEGGRIPFYEVF